MFGFGFFGFGFGFLGFGLRVSGNLPSHTGDLEEEAMAANSTAPPPPLLATMDETRRRSICRCGWVGMGGVGEELKDFSLI